MLAEIYKLYQKRRNNLIRLLEEERNELELGKQHQIYGAIKEIDKFLKTLEHFMNKEKDDSGFELKNNKY
jgi:hypothetical protein